MQTVNEQNADLLRPMQTCIAKMQTTTPCATQGRVLRSGADFGELCRVRNELRCALDLLESMDHSKTMDAHTHAVNDRDGVTSALPHNGMGCLQVRELKCELRSCASDLERSRKQAEQAQLLLSLERIRQLEDQTVKPLTLYIT
eukprot:5923168-Amphidinium_carterae.1